MTTTYDLIAGMLPWSDISSHPNRKATKAWAQRLTGTHPKYKVDGGWLDKQEIDGNICFDIETLSVGDLIKVSGASHSNKKHSYHRVTAVGDTALRAEKISEADAIGLLKEREKGAESDGGVATQQPQIIDDSDRFSEEKRELVDLIAEVDDQHVLKHLHWVLTGD